MRISVDFNHSTLGAVLSLSGDMAVVCAFFLPGSLRVTSVESKNY